MIKVAVLGPTDPRNSFVELICECGMDALAVPRGTDGFLPKAEAAIVVTEECDGVLRSRAHEVYGGQRQVPVFEASSKAEEISLDFLDHFFGRHRDALNLLSQTKLAWYTVARFWPPGERFTLQTLLRRIELLAGRPMAKPTAYAAMRAMTERGMVTNPEATFYRFNGLTREVWETFTACGLPLQESVIMTKDAAASHIQGSSSETSTALETRLEALDSRLARMEATLSEHSISRIIRDSLNEGLTLGIRRHTQLCRIIPLLEKLDDEALERFLTVVESIAILGGSIPNFPTPESAAARRSTRVTHTPTDDDAKDYQLETFADDESTDRAPRKRSGGKAVQKQEFEEALARAKNDTKKAARFLGMAETTFNSKRRSLGIYLPKGPKKRKA